MSAWRMSNSNVTVLNYQGREIHLIGTAHVSQKSVEEVRRVIAALQPDTVCVELDQTRYESLIDEHRFHKLDIFQVIKDQKVLYLLVTLLLTGFQRRLGQKLGVKPGAEMLAAVQCAQQVGATLVLADRDVHATLKRSWHSLSPLNKAELCVAIFASLFATNEVSEEQIEALKERDTIGEMMKEFARHMPRLQTPLIDERDRYLMSSIQAAPGNRIVAVVGAGHVQGMMGYLGSEVDREALSTIPKPSSFSKVIRGLLLLAVVAAFYIGYREHQTERLSEMIVSWVLATGIGAALFSAIAGARPLTILIAALATPLTTLIPTLGAGTVAALVEAWLRRPTVEDCEGINQAILSIRGMYKNPFTRILLVAFGATLGTSLGAIVGTVLLIRLL
jgi:pheromone shutdown-related protein TraB